MVGTLPSAPASVFSGRRSRLSTLLGPTPALVCSGTARARNYPANTFPFRADSHFLYLVGAAWPSAALLVQGDRHELFVPAAGDDDALWHGPVPTPEELKAATGVDAVRDLEALPEALTRAGGSARVATLPSIDPHTRARQMQWLERRWPSDAMPRVADLDALDVRLADAMIELRLTHDEAGQAAMRRAVQATAAAHQAGMAVTRAGRFEHEVRAAMERELVARGLTCAYGSIVTVHGEVLHNESYHHQLEESDLLLADVGGECEGWASDVTRTWPVSGRFSPTQRAIYDIVLQANLDAIAAVAPGVRYRDVHLVAAMTIARGLVDEGILRGDPEGLVARGLHALFFPHGVGHLLGLDVHDMEDLGDRAGYEAGRTRATQFGLCYLRLDRDLRPGMAVTIEPGIYFVPPLLRGTLAAPAIADGSLDPTAVERFSDVRGIRIEDDVLCTPTGSEVLTAAIPKAVAQVEAAVGSAHA